MKNEKHCSLLNYVSIFLFLMCIYPCVSAVASVRNYYDYNHTNEAAIMSTPSECVIESRELPKSNKFVYATGISPDRYNFHNRVRAFYYNKEYIQSLPPFLYRQYKKENFVDGLDKLSLGLSENDLALDAYYNSSFQYLIIPIPKEFVLHNYERCSILYDNRNEQLKIHQRIIRWLLGSLENRSQMGEFYWIEKDGDYFYILPYYKDITTITIPVNYESGRENISIYLKDKNTL